MRRVLIGAVIAGVGAVGAPALAHGTFVDARPLPGVDVGGEIDEVEFLFPEGVDLGGATIDVTDPDGDRVAHRTEIVSPVESVARVGIDRLTAPGEYRVDYRIPSSDGTVFEGAYVFTFDPSAPPLDPLPFGRESGLPLVLIGVGLVLVFVVVGAVFTWRTSRGAAEPDPGR